MNRCHFGRQPARLVLVDLSPPFDQDVCHNLQASLGNVLALSCALTGPSRIPFFGLYALGSYVEVLLPLQPTRGNFGRLQGALQELQIMCNELAGSRLRGCVGQGLRDALVAYQRQAQGMLHTAGYLCQLEVTLFSCQQPESVSRDVERTTKELNIESLKKVQVVCIRHPDKLRRLDDLAASQTSQTSSRSSDSNDLVNLADWVTLEADSLSLESYLKQWLRDSGTDREHIHLIVQQAQGDQFVLKCDFHERVLNAASLPFTSQFHVHPETLMTKPIPSGSKNNSQQVPILTLKVVKKVAEESICESVVFGLPLIVRSTSCWKMDWDELESNQQHFQALCQLLLDQKHVLLVQLNPDHPKPSSFRYHVAPPDPCGHFLLFPSSRDSLLLKSVATGELLLPDDCSTQEPVPGAVQHRMKDVLDTVEEDPGYNPLSYSSDLYSALHAHLGKHKQAQPPGPNKRRFMSANAKAEAQSTTGDFLPASAALTHSRQKKTKLYSGKEFYSSVAAPFPTEL